MKIRCMWMTSEVKKHLFINFRLTIKNTDLHVVDFSRLPKHSSVGNDDVVLISALFILYSFCLLF